MKFEEIYAHMAAEYKTLAGVEPEDATDVSIRLKVLAGELYTVLCAAESLKLNCFPQTAAGEALDLHAEERGLVRKDAVKSVGTLTFSRRTALSYAAKIPRARWVRQAAKTRWNMRRRRRLCCPQAH